MKSNGKFRIRHDSMIDRRWAWALILLAAGSLGVASQEADPVILPPRLPDGASVVTIQTDRLLEAPAGLDGIAVAATAPKVDLLYYPGQTYAGNPWSNWGDGVAVGDVYYSAIGDHRAPRGNAFVYCYDARTQELKQIVNLQEVLNVPAGQYTPGKIHSRIDMGSDGWLYFATHRGSTKVTTDEFGYEGDWIVRHHPETGRTEVIARGPAGKDCIPCSVLDPKGLIFYGGTASGDVNDKRIQFFAYDVTTKKILYRGYDGPERYMMFSSTRGTVYFVPGLKGRLRRYDPRHDAAPIELDAEIGIRAATTETLQGFIYTAGKDNDATLYRFDVRGEKVDKLGSAVVGTQSYITSLDADPSGRYLYYVPGAHGGSETDGSAVVQYDVRTGHKKVIAFLHPELKERFGFVPLGTFSTAVSGGGDKLFITWNGNLGGSQRGRLTWDACALTVIHIPVSEQQP